MFTGSIWILTHGQMGKGDTGPSWAGMVSYMFFGVGLDLGMLDHGKDFISNHDGPRKDMSLSPFSFHPLVVARLNRLGKI